jgi:hypothetical protein
VTSEWVRPRPKRARPKFFHVGIAVKLIAPMISIKRPDGDSFTLTVKMTDNFLN